MGCYNRYTLNHLRNLDVVLLEANHDENMLQAGPYPYPLKRRIMGEKGHLSNIACAMLLSQILHDHMKMAYLGHLSKTNNYADLAYATVMSELAMDPNCPYQEGDIPIHVASREHPMEQVRI
jgi:phosphoribosyl 1,2-cyclic phosphodiesterase